MSSPSVSIVVPVLNEAASIAARLAALQPYRRAGVEVLVVDGGSTDATVARAEGACDRVFAAPRGRGSQMNAGARAARGVVLIFLHADTTLPAGAVEAVRQAVAAGAVWGRFDVTISGSSRWFPLIAAMMNWRSRLTGIATGDQAIFVARDRFLDAGGFPDIALMEDVALCTLLRRRFRPACLRQKVSTSGRRWERNGVLRTVWRMWSLRWRYFFGADPERLAVEYGYEPRGDQLAMTEAPRFEIAVLAKAPIPGFAKTRLIPLLGPNGAARLQRWLLRRTLATAAAADLGPLTLWCSPSIEHPEFQACRELAALALRVQPEADLGARMLHAARQSSAQVGTLIVGTDCPLLDVQDLRRVAAELAGGAEAVVIPAEDGGYVLIALRRPYAPLFAGIAWSTPEVLAQTRQRALASGLRLVELAPRWDVDRPADYLRLLGHFPELAAVCGGDEPG